MSKEGRHIGTRMILVAALVALTIPFLGVSTAWAAAPTIGGFNPTSGPVGTTVTITGTGFNEVGSVVNDVEFNNVNATFTVNSDTQITATVPATATDGPIEVTDPEGTATSATNFDVTPSPTPTIAAFNPTSGPVGTVVSITGTGFIGASSVTFNGVAATTFTVNSNTQITATVPTGATSGPIAVTTPGGTATSATNFNVTGTEPVTHSRTVTLNLNGHLTARGRVSSAFADCESDVAVSIQRRRNSGGWSTVGTDQTSASGQYNVAIADREGRYRARVARETLGTTDVCLRDNSPKERHNH